MSEIAKPPTYPRLAAGAPGDVDGLLRAFFRAETPSAWPVPPRPAAPPRRREETPAGRRVLTLRRSRWALAAAVLFLLLGHAVLARLVPESSPSDPDRGSSATIGKKARP